MYRKLVKAFRRKEEEESKLVVSPVDCHNANLVIKY